MKLCKVLIVFLLLVISACSAVRVIVTDCQDLEGTDGQKNCRKISEL
jgi:hypothetical protein